jgi:hypothetical protein
MSRFHSPAGHTLIEILLALGLSLVILSAAYAALDQHWRYAEAGQRQTERMQVTRALFERMSLDLRSVVFRPDADFPRPTAPSDITRIDVVQRAELYVGRSVGIVGDGQSLVLQVNVPSVERPVGVQTIRWEMQPIQSDERNEDYADKSRAGAPADSGQGTLGLVRLARREATLDAPETVSPTDLLAAEVETIRFRYFARGSWFDHWDSVEREELPQAVEITISFGNVTAAKQTASDQKNPGDYRLIVSVPASEV